MLRWLSPENGLNKTDNYSSEKIQNKICEFLSSQEQFEKLKKIANSRTQGIWRIKRAKIIIGTLENKSVERMVIEVRVPPESIIKCQTSFAKEGLKYFEYPSRRPTQREANVEQILAFLENPKKNDPELWDQISVRYIGHDFSARNIQKIRDLILSNPNYCRNEIARKVCSFFGFYQSNGKIKLTQMGQILKRMDIDNVISLPPPRMQKSVSKQDRIRKKLPRKAGKRISINKSDIEQIQFIPVFTKKDSSLWRELIEQHHYIGTSRLFGAQMRYLVYGGKDLPRTIDIVKATSNSFQGKEWKDKYQNIPRGKYLLAVLGFAACAWRLFSRDAFIGWSDEKRSKNLKLIVNNVRFLILPHIKSSNLASRILGGVAKQLPLDWKARYNYKPVLLETFVQTDRFRGTCYRAANWIQIGKTEGYSLFSTYKKNALSKAIFVYPLCKDFRTILNKS